MLTVTAPSQSEYRIKGSKFIGFLFSSNSKESTDKRVEKVRKMHPSATHHCHASVYDVFETSELINDDGEPSGTAGFPILNAIKSKNLMNVCLTVVRYYGGTKLGKSGLIDAYRTTAQLTIDSASLHRLIPIQKYQISYDYAAQSTIERLKNTVSWLELDATYGESVEITVGCPLHLSDQFEKEVEATKHYLNDFEILGRSAFIQK